MDLVKARELAAKLGFWPATTNPEDIERHRQQNAEADARPSDRERIERRYRHLREEHAKEEYL